MLPPGSMACWTKSAAASISAAPIGRPMSESPASAARSACRLRCRGDTRLRRIVRRRQAAPCGHADEGKIAAPARHLHEAGAGARRRDRQFHFHQHFIGSRAVLSAPMKKSDAAIQRSPCFDCARNWPASARNNRRHFGCRIGMREIAADGPAIADLRVRDMGQSFVDEWQVSRCRGIALEIPVARQRSDAHAVRLALLIPASASGG